ncbi:hypothetical protein A7K93_03795 [Candidatus Methylacidiphilum fumarolicum]|uniref:VWFA domain-containing protein n=2 Tax=Candidatus Methylacidiphilum fumarolicum TaxID=591154 RepID=I0K1B0_METFB|nr:VWA domain-containing protein [Candidatus Methylacidiphilum fumarolicum]CCG93279.1 conserved membrane hypothetical protein [Methylacidiphilum fumariolicum SolV]MBW6414966.1 VWA domain-containing protein [Candidatus Methylacidiphilum fumarolicum]TFE70346.1 hypothetical protein A7K73_04020 [Candidatus Methylacidiphilum fumarolicum]TFE73973.1 hypothetical protein A7K72_05135 [Candidatus Methylacidiphilum fumarolicum]TFE74480.1 hypothetical protein A7K93_03795 [Candidatus Methylacidiphilum fuma
MQFKNPQILFGLLLLPLFLFLYYHRNSASKATFAHLFKVFFSHQGVEIKREVNQKIPIPWLFFLSSVLFIVALSRPQWGETDIELLQSNSDYLLAIDMSKSMLAEDTVPSRLERAKLLASNFVAKLQGERVGLLAFTRNAFVEVPFSTDYDLIQEMISALSLDDFPNGGTSFAAMMEEVLLFFSSEERHKKILILFSDGEDHGGRWEQKLTELKKYGVQVLAIGIGSPNGALIKNTNGSLYKDYNGQPIVSFFNPSSLELIAHSTGGIYVQADKWLDIVPLVQKMVKSPEYSKNKEKMKVLAEKYIYFLLPALLLALASFYWEFPRHERFIMVNKLGAKGKKN